MNNLKKLILIYIFGMLLFTSFLIPRTKAQEWTYDGADTERIPNFSVFPSEWYVYNVSMVGLPPNKSWYIVITKGNISDPLTFGNGAYVWGEGWELNLTSGEKQNPESNVVLSYWNETTGYFGSGYLIPVEGNGKVSLPILNNVSAFWEPLIMAFYNLEYQQVYPNIYSIAFWNETINNAYFHLNYTDDGILTHVDTNILGNFNLTLYSQPAQLPPVFSFTTESGSLSATSTDFKLNITITDADTNNDGDIDTAYQYRIQNGSTWSAWASPPSQLDWDLGAVADGNYDITVEVKNMYGVASDAITIQYTAPGGDGDGGEELIPSYPIAIISLVAIFSISLIILKHRKKLRF